MKKEGINTMDNKSELLLNILAIIAEEESISIGQNMRWAYERRKCGRRPLPQSALRVQAGTKRPTAGTVHESEARRVRFAFQSAGRGVCYRERS